LFNVLSAETEESQKRPESKRRENENGSELICKDFVHSNAVLMTEGVIAFQLCRKVKDVGHNKGDQKEDQSRQIVAKERGCECVGKDPRAVLKHKEVAADSINDRDRCCEEKENCIKHIRLFSLSLSMTLIACAFHVRRRRRRRERDALKRTTALITENRMI